MHNSANFHVTLSQVEPHRNIKGLEVLVDIDQSIRNFNCDVLIPNVTFSVILVVGRERAGMNFLKFKNSYCKKHHSVMTRLFDCRIKINYELMNPATDKK